jgi:hypothetical protein
MNQTNLATGSPVRLDFRMNELPISVKLFRPQLFQDDQGYYCLFGPDTDAGISGYGNTREEALDNWDMRLKERIRTRNTDDEVAQYALQILDASVEYS